MSPRRGPFRIREPLILVNGTDHEHMFDDPEFAGVDGDDQAVVFRSIHLGTANRIWPTIARSDVPRAASCRWQGWG